MGGKNKKGRAASESSVQKVKKDIAYYEEMLKDPNVIAFLQVIREGEGTTGEEGYHRLFGAVNQPGRRRYLKDLKRHPNYNFIYGYRRDKNRKIIYKNGKPELAISSAAGAYQFLNGSWVRIAKALGLGDFGKHNQDLAAVFNMDDAQALEDVRNGELLKAFAKLKGQWTSLPGGDQQRLTVADARTFYEKYGGEFHKRNMLPRMSVTRPGEVVSTSPSGGSIGGGVGNGFQQFTDLIFGRNAYKLPDLPRIEGRTKIPIGHTSKKPVNDGKVNDSLYSLPALTIQKGYTFDTAYSDRPLELRLVSELVEEAKKQDSLIQKGSVLPGKLRSDSKGKTQGAEVPANFKKRDRRGIQKKGAGLTPRQSNVYQYGDIAGLWSPAGNSSTRFNTDASYAKPKNMRSISEQYLTGELLSDDRTFNDQQSFSADINGHPVSVNLNAPLINNFSITTQQISEGTDEIRRQVELALLEVLNNVNAA